MKKKRYEYIDLAKGICIILVVLTHMQIVADIPNRIDAMFCSFRMPLYYILSGLFFSKYSGIGEFLIKKTNKLLIPFISFWILNTIVLVAFNRIHSYAPFTRVFSENMFYGGAIWFLVSLFICGLMFYLIIILSEHVKNKLFPIIIGSSILGVIGFYLGKNEINLPFWIDSSLTAVPFYAFGYILRKHTNLLDNKPIIKIDLPLSIVLLLFTFFFATKSAMVTNYMKSTTLVSFYLCGISGTLAVLFISKLLNYVPYISYYGRYSICILLTHQCLYKSIYFLIQTISGSTPSSWLRVLSFIILMIAYLFIIPFMIKYTPHICAQKDVIKINDNTN